MILKIRLVNRSHQKDYEALAKRAFGQAKGFYVRSDSLVWTPTDDAYPVIGVFAENKLLATMRIEWINSLKELNYKANEPIEDVKFDFPLGYLAKAATEPSQFGSGLNSLLRYHSFLIMKNWGVHSILGFMVEGSSRVFSMKEMGYDFFYKKNKWEGNFKSEERVLFAHLSVSKKLESAIIYLEKKLGPTLQQSQCEFRHEDIKMSLRIPMKFPWD